MKVQTATFIAASISAVSLVGCLIAMSTIYTDVQGFWDELETEISAFRVS